MGGARLRAGGAGPRRWRRSLADEAVVVLPGLARRARPRAPAGAPPRAARSWPAPIRVTARRRVGGAPGRPRDRRRPRRRAVRGHAASRRARRRTRAAPTARCAVELLQLPVADVTRRRGRSRCCRPTSPRWTWPRRRGSWAAAPASTQRRALRAAPASRHRARRLARRHPRRSPTATGCPTSARSARPASSSTPTSTSPSASAAPCSTRAASARPDHIVSVNLDASCPMMQLADLRHRGRRQRRAGRAGGRLGVAAAAATGEEAPMADVDVTSSSWAPDPAGSAAALTLARAGRDVLLVERGPFPGAKNMYGGVVYPRILDKLLPGWWEEAPIQRWVVRRATMLATGHPGPHRRLPHRGLGPPALQRGHGLPPRLRLVAGMRRPRPRAPCCSPPPPSTGLLRDAGGRVVGVRTDRPGGDITARLVIACDGVNSFLAKEAGLYGPVDPDELHARREGDAGPAEGGHRRALRRAGPRGRRLRDPRRHTGRARRRLPLHEPRHARRRGRAEAAGAGRAAAPARGDHRRPQGPPGHRALGRRGRAEGVLRAPHPRGRVGR